MEPIAPSQAGPALRPPIPGQRVVISFLFGFLFLILPWSGAGIDLRPDLMLLLLVYWTIHEPSRVGGWSAFFLGLLADMADSNTLGIHALGYSVVFALSSLYRPRILSFYVVSQTFHVLLLIAVSQVLTFLSGWALGIPAPDGLWWIQMATTALGWILLPHFLERPVAHHPPRAA